MILGPCDGDSKPLELVIISYKKPTTSVQPIVVGDIGELLGRSVKPELLAEELSRFGTHVASKYDGEVVSYNGVEPIEDIPQEHRAPQPYEFDAFNRAYSDAKKN